MQLVDLAYIVEEMGECDERGRLLGRHCEKSHSDAYGECLCWSATSPCLHLDNDGMVLSSRPFSTLLF